MGGDGLLAKFWYTIVDLKIAERYYWYYAGEAKKWGNVVSGICLLTTATSISAWYIWRQAPVLWAVLIALAQIVTVLKPLMPFSERLVASRYIYRDVGDLVVDAEYIWGVDGSGVSDEDARKYLSEFERKFAGIEGRFSTPDLFPQNSTLHDKAQRDAITYFETRYNTKEGVPG